MSSAAALGCTRVRTSAADPKRAASGRPNFLFFIADDLMFRTIHSINNPEVFTPNLDRIVAGGMHFTHCFHNGSWTGAVCVASRTMLNTGLSPFKAQKALVDNQSSLVPMWGQTLRNAGYRTFQTGKWHLDAVSLQRSFSDLATTGPGYLDSTHDPKDFAHSMYLRPAPGNEWSPTNRSLKGHWLDKQLWLNAPEGETKHSSEVYADSAIDFLNRKDTGHNKPFFMYVGFNAPHDPRQAPEEFQAMYPVDKIAIPPNYLPQHPFDQGDFHARDEQLAPFPRTVLNVPTHRKEYYAIITHMDAQIGRVLDALEESGHANNTYIIVTADHGLAVGEHGLMGKQNQYECSMRMPLMMKGPGIKPGSHSDEMVYQHSMYATTCDIAGVPVPKHVEFPSLKPMLMGISNEPINDAIFGWLNVIQRSIRTKQHKLIFYVPIKRFQLFDLAKDPWEIHDLVDDPAYAGVKTAMIAKLKAIQATLGDPLKIDAPPQVKQSNNF